MKEIVIYGAGGLAREVAHLIEDINRYEKEWVIVGLLEDDSEMVGESLNGYPVLGGHEWIGNYEGEINIVLGIGSPVGKRIMFEKIKKKENISFPNLIHPSVNVSCHNKIGIGNIICEGSILTCNIEIADFVTINLNSTIGHDTSLSKYVTISPNCSISGNVSIEEGVEFGTNATIIEKLTVGKYSIVGAGSVVVKSLPSNCTAVGAPAKPIKFHEEI